MKTAVKVLFWVFVFLLLVAGGLSAQQMNLDETITRAARGVEEVLPQGTKVAVLNFASPTEAFSDYVIDELTGKLVTGRKITIVDRHNLALISQEMNLQLSGDVSDESAQAIGKKLGAQSIVSGTLTNMGTFYRFRIRVINVETAAIQTQVSFDMQNDTQVAFLLSGSPASPQPAPSGGTAPGINTTEVTTPPIEGTIVPGTNLAAKLTWLQRSADSHNTYIVEVSANENIAPHIFEYSNAINITIVLRGVGGNRTIRLSSNGNMFTIRPNVTFILDTNITLQGHNGNEYLLVYIDGGTLRMNAGATISGNNNPGVGVGTQNGKSGTFIMNGGTISGNSSYGVSMRRGTFTMNGGTISGNSSPGVRVGEGTSFTLSNGTITGNTSSNGGGVYVAHGGTFTMKGGTISGNIAQVQGDNGHGGGVYIQQRGTFTKTGGTITGYSSDQSNGNVVRDDDGVLSRRGHAVSAYSSARRRETTAGPSVNLSYSSNNASGGWEN